MRRPFARAAGTLCILLLGAGALDGQEIRVEGDRSDPAVQMLETVVQRGEYRLLDRDTLLDASFHHPGDLVIWDAEVRLEGRIDGDVVVLGGTLHVRPGARVGGRMVTVRGLALASGRAEVGERIELRPGRVVLFQRREADLVVRVIPPREVAPIAAPGLLGLRRVSYDRVDGLSASWGPQLRLTRSENGVVFDAWGTVRSTRSGFGGGAELRIPLPAGLELRGRVERATLTQDAWIRGDLSNSLIALWGGHDVRDYHESDRAVVLLRRPTPRPLIQGEIGVEPFVAFVASRDRSLEERAPWALTGRDRLGRANPPVADSLLRSVTAGGHVRWVGAASDLALTASFENAPAAWSSISFSRWAADFDYRTSGLWNDRFDIRAHLRGTPGETPAPPQRWTHLGGPGTLPTLAMAAHRGDQLVYMQGTYSLPLDFLEIPTIGVPALRATFATGTAWLSGTEMPSWDQNAGLGFEVSFVVVQAVIDPRVSRPRPVYEVGLRLP